MNTNKCVIIYKHRVASNPLVSCLGENRVVLSQVPVGYPLLLSHGEDGRLVARESYSVDPSHSLRVVRHLFVAKRRKYTNQRLIKKKHNLTGTPVLSGTSTPRP